MSWNDYYRRRDVIDEVLRHARRDAGGPLPFDAVPGAAELFGTPENLLLAMHYRWRHTLGGRLRTTIGGPEETGGIPGGGDSDDIDAVSRAWRSTVADNPVLRAVLDAHVDDHPELRRAHDAELRMLALTAGVAELGESDEEITEAGNALVTLMRARTAGGLGAPRRNPVGQLLRKLAPTG
ncbi:hypothetical protein BJF85_00355 [Saccharomonospora sp. CUA-673]|uniref:hypothetical protein n=1 Tax=Saccharomonospora sp. CUA-673 TaxID=1904969 RepID=UPI000964BB79|nr:hypothetical protein [Saccharomonospora sp. CUA-673]OLT46955.1 hypothetical protein BJF85_00355 [Saccharomonospora sp. CUA-673]